MHVFLENTSSRHSDSTIHTLSWMNDASQDGEEKQTNSSRGWLACGTARNVVGVTLTDSSNSDEQTSERANFNLRGHRDAVIMVRWNEVYQKLATCDVNGVIFVWIKHNDRWSIELINDRNIQVTDFCWSCDGRLALICYRDGFVLIGSVAGRRLWSSSLRLESAMVTCASWTPAGQKVMFGTSSGRIIVLNWQGEVLSHLTLQPAKPIGQLLWSRFAGSMDWDAATETDDTPTADDALSTLAICFKDDMFHLLCSYDDLSPRAVSTGLTGLKMEWSSNGEILAVGGFIRLSNHECSNEVQFYSKTGDLCYKLPLTQQPVNIQTTRLTTLTWGHNDQRLFIAIGCHVHTACVSQCIPSIEFLSRQCIKKRLQNRQRLDELHLPAKLTTDIAAAFLSTIKGYIPDSETLRQFVCIAPSGEKRLYCSMMQQGDDHYGGHYTLYLEYLGGLLPLLKARRTSKMKPEFVIFDPKAKVDGKDDKDATRQSNDSLNDECEKSVFDSCASPRTQRRKRQRKTVQEEADTVHPPETGSHRYDNDLPESHALVEVTSNFWGTRFSIHGATCFLPADLGEIIYKTSLLHLQPRKMCLRIRHLRSSAQLSNQMTSAVSARNDDSGYLTRCGGQCSGGTATVDFGDDGSEDEVYGQPTVPVDTASPMPSRPQHIVTDMRATPEECRRAAVISPTGGPMPLRLCGALPTHLTTPAAIHENKTTSDICSTNAELASDAISSNWAIKACNDISYIDVDSGEWPDTPDRGGDIVRDVHTPSGACPTAGTPTFSAVFPTLKSCSLHSSATSLPDLLAEDASQASNASQSLPSSPKHTPSKTKKRRLRLWRKKDGLGCEPQQSPLVANGGSYSGLEAFQKAQLSKKLQRGKRWSEAAETNEVGEPSDGYVLMHNKTPQWNDISQVYQLDFGGRVTQESAKNFQVEFDGKQVLQFGRIESNAYTLDFEQPFSAVQAFAVALANVTQRLK